MKVKDLMTHDVGACNPDAPLSEAARIMWERDVGFVPVTDRSTGRLCGVVTDRDTCMAAYTQGRPLGDIPVRTAMSHRVFTCREDDDVERVHAIMAEHKVRRLAVTDLRGALTGVVTLNDLARHAQVQSSERSRVASTLGAIGERRTLALAGVPKASHAESAPLVPAPASKEAPLAERTSRSVPVHG